jgi:phage gp36-like protein
MQYTDIYRVQRTLERIPNTAAVETDILQFIEDADAIIDAKVRGKVTIPFAATPPLIRWISTSLATYFTLRSLFGSQTEDYQEWIEDFWDKPMEVLQDLADCKYTLDDDDAVPYDAILSNTSGKTAIFDLGDVESQDYHDDGSDDRYGEDS